MMKQSLLVVSGLILMALSHMLTVHAQDGGVIRTASSPYTVSAPVDLADVSLTEGFWKQRTEVNREVSIPYLYQLAADPGKGHVIRNFEIAAGLKEGRHAGTNWQDAWAYKWIEAASYSLVAHPDQELEARIDSLVELIAMAQEEDGYIATQVSVKGAPRYNDPHDHEFYTMGHLMTAAAVHYRITGKPKLLEVADRCADYIFRTVSEVEVNPVKITMIPYYAWNNRQEPKMRVWLPLFIGGK